MKTYKKTIEKTCLEIQYDEDCESPREWSNLGYFITVDSRYNSPDKNKELEDIIKETGEEATSQENHMEMIKTDYEWENSENKVIAIYPISKYEHSGISYSLGTAHGFDYSNNGFYIITTETQKEMGTKKKDFERVIQSELDLYNKWCNGEVYGYTLYDDKGGIEDSCWGFYDLEHIREELPEEYKEEDLQDYLIE